MIFGIENLLLVTLDSAFMRLQNYDPLGQLSGFFCFDGLLPFLVNLSPLKSIDLPAPYVLTHLPQLQILR